ncbi:RebB family R body protein [Stenotrophomonas maltophilia]|uniref:Translation initiation factor 2 n=1 Tax=Stenotrophomonas maltophilia TaxID=40324 RepID=A0A4S2D118_STEMA|nr:RebB family R body protein [Stenotrophomonas maltophilia]TGY34173.1 translation initiation factor 2 [Stenotrophomonas maltophilia]
MSDPGTMNSQIVDTVNGIVTLAAGQAPGQAHAMLDIVLLETLGNAMHNAVNRQQSASMISAAAITAACAKMISAPFPVPPPPPPPVPPPPPNVAALPGPPPIPPPPAAVIAAATAEGKAAIGALKAQATGSSANAGAAQADLQTLHDLSAAATSPSPPPSPPPAPAAPASDPNDTPSS